MKRNRVLIENVIPELNDGRFFVKRTVGGGVVVSADIYADGYDSIRARVLYRHEKEKNWHEIDMASVGTERWNARFVTDQRGIYFYKIQAWIDHLKTWYDQFKKKYLAGDALQLELLVGAELLQKIAAQNKTGNKEVTELAAMFSNPESFEKSLERILSPDFEKIVQENVLKNNVTEYDKNLKVKVGHQKGLFSTWYQLFPRSASPVPGQHGTFKDVENLLPRIARLGFDVLYLPPIHPIGFTKRKGKNNALEAGPDDPGSVWAIGNEKGGHYSIHEELGTFEDFDNLLKAAKEAGIDVALDLAFQCSPDHPWLKEHPQWFKKRPDGTIAYAENPPFKYEDVVPFDFETDDWENLWNELRSVVLFWVEKGVQIFRVAVPQTKPINFWEWLIAEINRDYPDVIFLSAAFAPPKIMSALSKAGFAQSFTYFISKYTRTEIEEYMKELTGPEMRQHFRPNFWPNVPDILPYHLMNGDSNVFSLRLVLAATLSSNYGIYGPAFEFMENRGVPNGKQEYLNSEKYEIRHWDWNQQNRITFLIQKMNQLRKENAALQSTFNINFTRTDNDEILSFVKSTDDGANIIWCIFNFDSLNTQSGFVEVPKRLFGIERRVNIRVHDLLTDETYHWFNDWNYIELNPSRYPAHIFRVEILYQPAMMSF